MSFPKRRGLSQFQGLQSPPSPAMTSPTAIFLIPLLILVLFATAATAATPSTSSSVGFSGISEHEAAIKKCDIVIHGGCTDEKCCLHRCKMRIPYAKTIEVSHKVVNGAHRCYCHAIYSSKPGSCAP